MFKFYGITLHWGSRKRGFRIGVEHSMVVHNGSPYLERWIVYCGITLRLHKFHRGDDDRAFHDHPWWFVTFPLRSYRELVFNPQWGDTAPRVNIVRAFRFHYRPADYRHRVLPGLFEISGQYRNDYNVFPAWTIVISGDASRTWGFWPTPNQFIPYTQWEGALP
jgi:hypothetical protein